MYHIRWLPYDNIKVSLRFNLCYFVKCIGCKTNFPGKCNTENPWSSWNNMYLLIWLIRSPDLSVVKHMKNCHPTCKSESYCQQLTKLYVKSCTRNDLEKIPQLQIAIFIRIMCQMCMICTCAIKGLAKY